MSVYKSYAYDPYGNKVDVYIKDGLTYTQDGKRIGAGYTVQTAGGIYKMGEDGKGYKVDSHNTAPVITQPPKTTNQTTTPTVTSTPVVKNNTVKNTSNNTLRSRGYYDFYQNELDELQSRYDYYVGKGNQTVADSYKQAVDRKLDYLKKVEQFADWDIEDLDRYVHNKTIYHDLTTNPNSRYTKTIEELMAENQALREKYNLTEDILDFNAAGQLGADIIWGDFIKYGLDKEDESAIPAITSSDMKIDPKFEIARSLARRDYLFGYKPLGEVTSINGKPVVPDYSREEEWLTNAIKTGTIPKIPKPKTTNDDSTSKPINVPTNTEIFVPLTPNGDGIGKTSDGKYFVSDGDYKVEVKEVDVINYFTELYGF